MTTPTPDVDEFVVSDVVEMQLIRTALRRLLHTRKKDQRRNERKQLSHYAETAQSQATVLAEIIDDLDDILSEVDKTRSRP